MKFIREMLLPMPTIVCLCGSTKFFEQFTKANYEETSQGRIVLSVGFFMHRSAELHKEHEGTITPQLKTQLDELHLRKIDLSDEVLCINVNDYIGASTRRELWYAAQQNKRIRMLEAPTQFDLTAIKSWFTGWDDWLRAAHTAASTTPK